MAVKVIDRFEVDDDESKVVQLEREMNIWNKLKHPNIINLLEVVFEDDWVLLVVEYAGGGSLYSIVSSGCGPIPEERARMLFQQMLAAVEYCNSSDIFHRDLKLENVVFASPGLDTLKLTDFGASKDSNVHSAPKSKVGTIAYMAPEVVDVARVGTAKTYDGAADIWSLGVILFVMCIKRYPFGFDGAKRDGGVSPAVVYRRVRLGWPAGLEGDLPAGMSEELAELFAGLLHPQPSQRWEPAQIRASRWLAAIPPYQPVIPPPTVMEEIKLPPRQTPRPSGGMMQSSYGSFGSLGFGGFPSFSGNDGLLSLSLPKEGLAKAPGASFDSVGSLADVVDVLGLSDESAGSSPQPRGGGSGSSDGLALSGGSRLSVSLEEETAPPVIGSSRTAMDESSPMTVPGPPVSVVPAISSPPDFEM